MSTCQNHVRPGAPERQQTVPAVKELQAMGAIRLSEDSSQRDGGGECGADVSAKCCRSSEGALAARIVY